MNDDTMPYRAVEIQIFSSHYTVALGSSVQIPFAITNRTGQEDYFEITVEGIPFEWLFLDLPVIYLQPDERREASLSIQAPGISPTSAGEYPIHIQAVSQSRPDIKADAEFHLTVFEEESSTQVVTRQSGAAAGPTVASGVPGGGMDPGGRLGVLLNTTQFSIAPGETLTVPVVIANRDLREHTYSIQVDGLPQVWVSASIPTVHLLPGEHKEILLYIQPAATSNFHAGRYPFNITVTSVTDPEQRQVVEALLTLAAFGQFSTDLSPQRIQAGQTARLRIHNTGNYQDTYTVRFQNVSGNLDFVPSVTGPVRLMPGESAAVDFVVSPNSPNMFGSPTVFTYSVVVQSAGGEAQGQNGEVVGRSLIPIWVIPLMAIACLAVICGLGFLWNVNQNRLTAAQETADAQLGFVDAQTATADAALTFTVGTLTSGQTATAAALTAIPTVTFTETVTPLPSETPPTPTETLALPTPTLTATVAPTNTLAPPTATLAPTLPPATATVQPLPISADQIIGFASNRDGGLHLYLFRAQDGSMSALTDGGMESQPAWSPDGDRIVFTSGRDGNNEIYLMNADGSGLTNLTNSPSNDSFPAWSPNGEQIAFATDRDGNNEIYVMNADGSDLVNLTNSPSNDFKAAWYAQSGLLSSTNRILFVTDRDGNYEIYAMDVDGANPENLSNSAANETLPAVPYEGDRAVFVSDRDGNLEIYVMDLDGDNQENLTNNPAADSKPVWSPDGQWIAFTTDRDGNREVYIMNAEGGEVTNLSRNPADDIDPAWR